MNDYGGSFFLASAAFPFFELPVDVFNNDDGGIDHCPDGDGNPPQRHDVCRELLAEHRNKGEQHGNRERDDRDKGRASMQKKNSDNETHDHHFFNEGVAQRVDGAQDQLRAVIGNNKLNPFGERIFDLGQPLFDGVDDRERVLAVAHNDDAPDRLAFSIELGQSPALIWPEPNSRHIAHQNRHALAVHGERNRLQVLR